MLCGCLGAMIVPRCFASREMIHNPPGPETYKLPCRSTLMPNKLLVVKNVFICSSDEFAPRVFRPGPNREAGAGLMPFVSQGLVCRIRCGGAQKRCETRAGKALE